MPSKQALEDFWSKADADGNGELTIQEFRDVALACRQNGEDAPTDRFLAEMFADLDDDGSKTISKAEYMKHVDRDSNNKETLMQAFKDMDTDGNGTITKDEIVSLMEKNGMKTDCIDDIIKDCDSNNDGKINAEEFINLF